MARFRDIPQLPKARYSVDFAWVYIEQGLEQLGGGPNGLNLDPDYQRAHVWTPEQQRSYIEYMLMGGEVGKFLTFNAVNWMSGNEGPMELVDGKQRLEAVRAFLRDEVLAFGRYFSEYEDRLDMIEQRFTLRVCSLSTRAEILQLYLNINAGGTPHTQEELDRVRALLKST